MLEDQARELACARGRACEAERLAKRLEDAEKVRAGQGTSREERRSDSFQPRHIIFPPCSWASIGLTSDPPCPTLRLQELAQALSAGREVQVQLHEARQREAGLLAALKKLPEIRRAPPPLSLLAGFVRRPGGYFVAP